MAVDKLVDSTQLDADLTSVANAIRAKGGTSAQLAFPNGFMSAVNAIPTGGGGYTLEEIAENTIFVGEDIVFPDDITFIGDYAFYCRRVKSVSGNGIIEIGARSFAKETVLQYPDDVFTFNLPNLERAKVYAFGYVNWGNLPVVCTAYTIDGSSFEGGKNMPSLKLTRATTIGADIVYRQNQLATIIINSTPNSISTNAFRTASLLTDIYVPWSEGDVANAPWGATSATIHYNTVFDANGDPT